MVANISSPVPGYSDQGCRWRSHSSSIHLSEQLNELHIVALRLFNALQCDRALFHHNIWDSAPYRNAATPARTPTLGLSFQECRGQEWCSAADSAEPLYGDAGDEAQNHARINAHQLKRIRSDVTGTSISRSRNSRSGSS